MRGVEGIEREVKERLSPAVQTYYGSLAGALTKALRESRRFEGERGGKGLESLIILGIRLSIKKLETISSD